MDIPLLSDILIIFSLSIFVLYFCHRLKIPTVIGFILTGILAGPHGFGLISATHDVDQLAEIGIVLLLFTIGIEFSLKSLWQVRKGVLLGGYLQVLITVLATVIIARSIGLGLGESIFVGFLVSLSSTAIALKLIQERKELSSPHGKVSLAVLIFQDVIVVPMILFIPLLAGATSGDIGKAFVVDLVQGISIIILVIASARWLVPKILFLVSKTLDRELFLLTIVVICLAVAWLTSKAGLSLALGAFLAGIIISESEYSHQALTSVLPFKDVFTSLFFVSIGMLLDVSFFFSQPHIILTTALGVMLLKMAVASTASAMLGFPLRTNLLVGVLICQVGEFSFILSKAGQEYGLLQGDIYQVFLAVSILTMIISPLIVKSAVKTVNIASGFPMPPWFKSSFYRSKLEKQQEESFRDHLVIIGYGTNGKILGHAAKNENIPYVIIDTNPETVRYESAKGEPIIFGDATHEIVLKKVNVADAKIITIATSDLFATNLITKMVRQLSPLAHIIVRIKYKEQTEIFNELGANEIISEETETSVVMLSKTLRKYFVDEKRIEFLVQEARE